MWRIFVLSVALSGCAGHSTVVLLPDADGKVGVVEVVSKAARQTQTLTTAYQAAAVATPERTPDSFTTTPEAVQRTYGAALAAQPAAPLKFSLNFASGKPELTPESQQLLPTIMSAIQTRQSTDISIIGHADTVGDAEQNRVLSGDRAQQIATFFIQQGVSAANLEVSSHGEANLAVPTPDEVAEPRNRRVEVTVR
jgi:outer membrane protein OmpA-like peptidoglycan-associated protein